MRNTMSNTEALRALATAVEAGTIHPSDLDAFIPAFMTAPDAVDALNDANNALDAYRGSLDAAKALLEAALPGWGWETGVNTRYAIAQVWLSGREKAFSAKNADPARAVLLASIRAKIGGET